VEVVEVLVEKELLLRLEAEAAAEGVKLSILKDLFLLLQDQLLIQLQLQQREALQ
jgi:hypothetical protein